jgi:hypothetical protein
MMESESRERKRSRSDRINRNPLGLHLSVENIIAPVFGIFPKNAKFSCTARQTVL